MCSSVAREDSDSNTHRVLMMWVFFSAFFSLHVLLMGSSISRRRIFTETHMTDRGTFARWGFTRMAYGAHS